MASQVTGWAGQIEDDDGTLHALGSTAYGYCQTAAATAAKVVDMTGFKLVTGATIFVKFQYANSVANPTLNVNSTGAKPIYRYGTTRPSTNASTNGWPAGAVMAFTYDGSGWQGHYWYNNQYTLSNQHQSNGNFTADSAIYRYQLLFHMDEDTLSPLNNADNNTGTSKTMLTTMEFDPFLPIYEYDSTTNVAANGNVSASSCHFQQGAIDLRFSFNCGDSSLTNMKNVYLKCSKQSNGKFRIASAAPLTQTLPSAADGYYYILLGRACSGFQIGLYADKPIFYHDGTALRIYTDPAKAVPFAALAGAPTDNSALNAALAGKAAADHNHDSAYAAKSHTHDDRYYTETEINTKLAAKQDTLTFDTAPTASSTNPVTSGGVKTALDGKAAADHNHDSAYAAKSHTHDDRYCTETEMNTKLAAKQDTLTFDTAPTANSTNPVTSGGVKTALDNKYFLSTDNSKRIKTIANDTVPNWQAMKHCVFFYSINDELIDKPSDYGILINNSIGNEVSQIWVTQPSGKIYRRSGSANGWSTSWVEIFSGSSVIPTANGGTGGTDSGWQSLTNASVFTGAINYRKVGAFLVISTYYINLTNQLSENAYVTLGQLPSGYRPTRLVIAPCIVNNSGMANRSLSIMIWTDGVMQLVSNNEPVKTTYPIGFSGFGLV